MRWGLLFLAGLVMVPLAMARAEHTRGYGGDIVPDRVVLPRCDDPGVIGKVIRRFDWADRKTWHHNVAIKRIDRIRERADPYRGVTIIVRRYCSAHAYLSNGKHPRLYYLIESRQGFAGTGWGVEFCLRGYDYYRAYDGGCRVLWY